MELLQLAACSNDFGLRRSFKWSERSRGDTKAKVDVNISRSEESYLADKLGSVFGNIEDYFVGRVENPNLWSRYVLKYEEMKADPVSKHVEENIVVHATSISAAYEIADNNFDWRLVKRSRFGKGVSFARDVDYAAGQATQVDAYIVAGILVASKSVGSETLIPPRNVDTTINRANSVCVKYYDNDFYPYYIVY